MKAEDEVVDSVSYVEECVDNEVALNEVALLRFWNIVSG